MPLLPINISQGVNQNVDAFEHGDSGSAVELRNLLINDAGSNVGRPGLTQFATIGSYGVIGMTYFGDKLFVVTANRHMYSISSAGVVTDVTDGLLGGTSRPVFANDGTYLAIAAGGTPKRWSGSGNTEDMPGSPEDCTHITYLDGYWLLHLLNDQEIRWAGPTSSARESWNSANFFQAEGLPDDIVAQADLLREFYVFGSTSTEVFYNYGDSSVPFKRTFFLNKGVAAPYSVVQTDNTLWWLDSDRRFVTVQGRAPVMISSPYDKVIRAFDTVDDCWGAVIDINGHYCIAWTFPTEDRTFVFDYKNKQWSEWDSYFDAASVQIRMHSHSEVKAWNRHFVGDPVNGTIWQLSEDVYADGTLERRLLRRTGQISHGTRARKRSNFYLFDVKRGNGTPGSTEPKMVLRVNDDGKGWSQPVEVGLGFAGDDQSPIRVHMRGIYRKRQLEVQVTDAVDFKLNGIEEDVEVMNS